MTPSSTKYLADQLNFGRIKVRKVDSSYVEYSGHQLLAQRVYGIVLGYPDVNDHEKLRYDPALAIALQKLEFINSEKTGLAGKSTINRLEYCPETIINSLGKSLP